MGKMTQIRQVSNFKKFQIARALWQLPEGSQDYRRMLFFFYLHIYYAAKFGKITFWTIATLATSQNL
jgi:hypothetical protein